MDDYPVTWRYRLLRRWWQWQREEIVLTTIKPARYQPCQFIRVSKDKPVYEVTRVASGNGKVWDVWGVRALDADDLSVGIW